MFELPGIVIFGIIACVLSRFFDLDSDLRLLESWIRSAIWTPWILLLILGSPNFRGLAKALSKNESSV